MKRQSRWMDEVTAAAGRLVAIGWAWVLGCC